MHLLLGYCKSFYSRDGSWETSSQHSMHAWPHCCHTGTAELLTAHGSKANAHIPGHARGLCAVCRKCVLSTALTLDTGACGDAALADTSCIAGEGQRAEEAIPPLPLQ